jgi:MSHA biogenesis protein MshP
MSARTARRGERGAALVVALFVLVVLAAFGAFAFRINMTQQHDATLDIQELRATAALDAGIEYAAARLLAAPGNNCASLAPVPVGGFTVRFGFAGATPCSWTPYQVNGVTVNIYTLNLETTVGAYGTPEFVARRALTVRIVG